MGYGMCFHGGGGTQRLNRRSMSNFHVVGFKRDMTKACEC